VEHRIELEYAIGEGVAPAEIIEEPAINLGITKCLLNFADTLVYGRYHCRGHLIAAMPRRQ
jgi:hypothetical protein